MGTRARPPTDLGARHVVPWGPPALDLLDRLIADAQSVGRLAPVTVVVPSSHAGTTVRRRLAGRPSRGGLVNVAFVSFPQVAERLAAPRLAASGRAALESTARLATIRSTLIDHPQWFTGAPSSPSALATLDRTLTEVGELEPASLDRLATFDPRAERVVALLRAVRARWSEHVDDRDVVALAIDAVEAGDRSVDELGHVIVYLPRRLRPLDVDLAAVLADRGRLTIVVGTEEARDEPGSSADGANPPADDAVWSGLAPRMPVVEHRPGDRADTGPPPDIRFVRAPDPHEEVRQAVRSVLDAAARGVPADAMAVVARVADPYFALLHEEMAAAGVPHHGPTGLQLAQSVPGRVLLGALDLFEHDLPRVDVFRWLRSGPVRGPDGAPLPVDELDRIAREAGIPGGLAVWFERLDAELEQLRARQEELAAGLDDATDPSDAVADDVARAERVARRIDHVTRLRALVEWLGEGADVVRHADTWAARATWAADLLDVALGPPDQLARTASSAPPASAMRDDETDPGAGDEAAYLRIRQILATLASLDEVDDRRDGSAFRAALTLALDAPGPPAGRFGHGVFVGSLAEAAGADHDLLVVVGMAEGIYPPRGQDDPVLPDAVRAQLGELALVPRRRPRADERRDHVAALAGSASVVLGFPRADTRAQRERYPAWTFLDEVRRRWGRPSTEPVGIDELDRLAAFGLPWWHDAISFVAAVEQAASGTRPAPTLVGEAERTAAAMLASRSTGDADPIAVPADRPSLVRGATAVLERQAGHFGTFTGRVGPHDRLRFDGERVGSATALESWATCPFRYFVRQVLHVRPLDERSEADDINALDRGSYVHEVLERVVGDGVLADPAQLDAPLGAADLDRLRHIAAEVGERFRVDGRTGRPLLWRLRSRQLLHLLEQIVEVDRKHRLDRHVQPVAVELSFGSRDADGEWVGVPPVVVDLSGDRSVAFRGFVDRVDRSSVGDELVVIDYKTGSSGKYREVRLPTGPGDIVGRGQHLQLGLYAMAAETAFGDAMTVSAFFWFVEQSTDAFVGGPIDEWARQRLVQVLEVIVGGIEHGWFPARPGKDGFFGFENCGFCDFNRICPSARAEQWELVRWAPELDAYRDLAEGELVTPGEAER
jgi:hypothetical protein